MQKIKVKIKINDYIINEIGIIDNDILKVQDKNEIITYNYKINVLEKENSELKLTLDFENKEVVYYLPELNQKISTNFTLISLTNSNKQVIIRYRIEETDFLLEINYETI